MKNLPIIKYQQEIVEAVKKNAVTIIKAETGAGKSTQVPQMLLAAGYEVVVTQPRRLAARTIAERIAEERGEQIGSTVGYRTGYERKDSWRTQILFCTDGLQLVRELTDRVESSKTRVLIIDEVHEWNLNIETLIAWCKKRVLEGWNIKVVVMSASFDDNALKDYFGMDTPVINVPGKMYPVKMIQVVANMQAHIKKLVDQKKNVLVFVPGKQDIRQIIKNLEGIEAVVLPLHGELDIEEQKRCFQHYKLPKVIIATNVAQTSITVNDIDAVVDTGKERRLEVENGVEGLYLRDISQADCIQRKGRAGRTKEGIYVLNSTTKFDQRPEFSVPEIQRSNLDHIVLRLASIGIDAAEIEFFHQPNIEAILDAKKSLTNLGALEDNKVTKIGYKISKIPVSCKYARMILEADKRGVTDDVIIITAILEVGGLLYRSESSYSEHTNESCSDLLAELSIWKNIQEHGIVDFKVQGILPKSYYRTKELIKKLRRSLRHLVTFGTTGNREDILLSCVSGLADHLYQIEEGHVYYDENGNYMNLDRKSCVSRGAKWIVGIPKIIEFQDRYGELKTLEFINMVTKVDLNQMIQLTPHLFKVVEGLCPFISSYDEECYSGTLILYKGKPISKITKHTPEHPEAARLKYEREQELKRRQEVYERKKYEREQALKRKQEIDERKMWYANNTKQQKILCDDLYLDIQYDSSCNPFIHISETFLYQTSQEELYLDNGKKILFYCNDLCAYRFPELREMVEKKIFENNWNEAKEKLPQNLTTSLSVIEEWLPYLGKQEISRKNLDDVIYGYVYLKQKEDKFCLDITLDEKDASYQTSEALRFLLEGKMKEQIAEEKVFSSFEGKRIRFKKGNSPQNFLREMMLQAIQNFKSDDEDSLKLVVDLFENMTA